ncbi:MAG: hypothetical protein ACI4QW_02050, partial [Clostridia bacterium]
MFSRQLNEQIAERNLFALEAIRNTIDEQLLFVEKVSAQLSINEDVLEIVEDVSMPLDAEDKYKLYKLVRSFETLLGLSGYTDRTYIYFKHLDLMAKSASTQSADRFYDVYLQGSEMSREAWRAFVEAPHDGDYFILDFFGRRDEIFYIKTIPIYSEDTTINIILNLDKASLASAISKLYLPVSGQLDILDTEGNVVLQVGDLGSGDSRLSVEELQEQRSILTYDTHSQVNGWKYIYFLPKKIAYKDINRSKSIILCCLFGGFLICVYIAISSFRFNRSEFREIVGLFSGDKDTVNEYRFLKEKIEHSLLENRQLSEVIDSRNAWLQNNILLDLLVGRKITDAHTEEELKKMGLQSDSDEFLVALYFVEQEESEDGIPCSFVINNVFDELLTRRSYLHYAVNYESCVVYIIKSENDKVRDNVFEALTFTYDFIAENFSFKFYGALGEVHKKRAGIALSYSEAHQTLEYCLSCNQAVIEDYHKIKDKLIQDFYYSQKMEDQLINLIKVNDKPKLRLMLEDVFKENRDHGYLSMNSARYLVINLFDTIKRFLLRFGVMAEQVFGEEYKFVNEIFQHDSIEEMKEVIFSVYESCYDKVLLKLNMKEELADKIIAYILQHYTDQALGIQQIADYFSL